MNNLGFPPASFDTIVAIAALHYAGDLDEQKHSLDFQTWEFTEQEIKIWKRQLQVAKELLEVYREEGNLDLCEDRIEECEVDLPRLEAGKKRCYLYHVLR